MTSDQILKIIERDKELFDEDVSAREEEIYNIVSENKFLVLGGAGSIGQAVVKEIFKRNPKKLYVVDISENNLVELVRDLRSSIGYIDGEFKTFALDIGSIEFDALIGENNDFDYVLNLSALKHVRSERDQYTLMRMIDVNITNTIKTLKRAISMNAKKYFCVSTDKAANPVNMMGASKRIMELYLNQLSSSIDISTARFANVAFSDGSLLHGFNKRMEKRQPIVAPNDVDRYFVTPKESGELCLVSCLFGKNGDTFFPQENDRFVLTPMKNIAVNYLRLKNINVVECASEEKARNYFKKTSELDSWPCYFPSSDTTGEKAYEEFYTENEVLDLTTFKQFGVIKNKFEFDKEQLSEFLGKIQELRNRGAWTKQEIVILFQSLLPEFHHMETGKYLDSKM
jgi:FlaA1/EpsC-like NDP-sugar epimerase